MRSYIRLATSLVIEHNDEWLLGRRYVSLDSLASLLEERRQENDDEEVPAHRSLSSQRICRRVTPRPGT
jgi:hypothetical protein